MDPTFIIKIIVRARQEIESVMAKATGSVDKVTDAQGRQVEQSKKVTHENEKVGKSVADLQTRYQAFVKDVERGNKSYDDAAFGLKRFNDEFAKLSRQAPAGSKQAEALNRTKIAIENLQRQLKTAHDAEMHLSQHSERERIRQENARQEMIRERTAAEKKSADEVVKAEQVATRKRQSFVMSLLDTVRTDHAEQLANEKRLADEQVKESVRVEAARATLRQSQANEEMLAAKRVSDAHARIMRDEIDVRGKDELATVRQTQAQRSLREEIRSSISAYEDFIDRVRMGDIHGDQVGIGLKQHASRLSRVEHSATQVFAPGSDEALLSGSKAKEAQGMLRDLNNDMRKTRSVADDVHDALGRLFRVDPSKLERIDNKIEDFNRSLTRGRFNVAAFDNRLRGLIYVGIFAFFQQLVGVVGAVAGALVSLAGAAVQAGAALAGMAAAGAAQLFPLLGLLGAAWGRIGAVFKAAQQAQKSARQAADNHSAALKNQHQAMQGVQNAQTALTKARFDALRNLEDLIAAERKAQLQAEASVLAQSNAQRALREAISSGDVSAQAQAELDLRNANEGVTDANLTRRRARQDAQIGRRQGVEGSPGVVAAKQQLDNARQAAADAKDQFAAVDKTLNQLLAQLSPAERRLYETVRKIQSDFKKTFRPITDIIVSAFDGAVKRVDKVMKDPRIVGTAKTMANAVGGQITRISKFLTSDKNLDFFSRMGTEVSRNLPHIITIFEHFYNVFRNWADAASPALRTFIGYIEALSKRADAATSGSGGLAKLTKFFSSGEKNAESIINLGIALGQFFLALSGASAADGMTLLDSMTAKINQATTWIQEHQGDVQKFFHDSREALGYIGHAIWELSKAIFGLFHVDQVKAFADAFTNVLLPTLENVFKVLGVVTGAFLKFAGSNVGSALMQFLLTTTLLLKAFTPIVSLFSRLIVLLGTLFSSIRLVTGGLTLLEIATGPVGIFFAGIAALLLLINDRLGSFNDLLSSTAPLLAAVAGAFLLKGPIGKLFGIGATAAEGARAAAAVRAAASSLPGAAARTGIGVVAAAEGGGIAAAVTKIGLGGLLKKAGWIGIGYSAVQGIISGFKSGQAKTGLRDFLHDVTFGLTRSAEQIAHDAATKLNNALKKTKPVKQIDVTTSTSGAPRYVSGGRAGGMSAPTEGNQNKTAYQNLTDFQKNAFDAIQQLRRRLVEMINEKKTPAIFNSFYQNLVAFAKTAPPEFKSTLDAMLKTAEDHKKKLDAVFAKGVDVNKLVLDFGVKLQGKNPDFKKLSDSFLDQLKTLPKGARAQAVSMVAEMVKGLGQDKLLPKKAVDNIGKYIVQSWDNTAKAMAVSATKRNRTQSRYLDKLNNIVKTGLWDTGGMIDQLNSALDAMGAGKVKVTPPKGPGGVFGGLGGDSAMFPAASGQAKGGYVGQKGERGGDVVPRWLGRGEAVLNWAHQRVVEPGLAFAKAHGFPFGSLGEVFKRVRGKHGAEADGGLAVGGIVGSKLVTPNFYGRPTNVFAGVRELISIMETKWPGLQVTSTTNHDYLTTTGNVSDHSSGHAVDVASSDYGYMNRAAEWVKSSGLYRFIKQGIHNPNLAIQDGQIQSPPGRFAGHTWDEHIGHIHLATYQMLDRFVKGVAPAGWKAVAGGVEASAAHIQKIVGPKVTGDGAMGDIMRAIFKKATGAANKRVHEAAAQGTGGTGMGGTIPAFKGPWTKVMAKIADAKHWVLSDWRTLVAGESGGNTEALNPSSGAFGLGQFLGATARAYAKFGALSHDGTKQIRAMAQYISDRYGNPTNALHTWLSRSPHWYEKGGEVPGNGPQPIVAHGGEHMWTASEVAQAGGHKVLYALRKIFGGGGQGGPMAYAAGGRVLEIGDSLGVGTESYLKRRIKNLDADNLGGRSAEQGVEILKNKISKAYKKVIFDLGTNDATAEGFARSLRKAYRLVGKDRTLVLNTVNSPYDQAAKNKYLREFAAKHDNVTLNDWTNQDKGLLSPDGIHATAAGYKARAKQIAEAAKKGGGGNVKKFDMPTIYDLTPEGLIKQVKSVNSFLKKLKTKSENFIKSFSSGFQEMAGDNGFLDKLQQSIQSLSDRLSTSLTATTFRVNKAGNVIQKIGDVKIADKQAANLTKVYDELVGEKGVIASQLNGITDRIAALRKGGISKSERKTYEYLVGFRRNLQGRLDQVSTDIANNLQARYQAVEAALSARVDRANNAAGRRNARLDLVRRGRELMGNLTPKWATGIPQGLVSNEAIGRREASSLNTQADDLQKVANLARKRGHGKTADALLAQISDLRLQALEAVSAGLSADADEITRKATRRQSGVDLKARILTALGRVGDVANLATERIGIVKDQIAELTKKQRAAAKAGFGNLAQQIGDQIAELQTTIFEITAQQLQDSIDAVNNAASRRSSQLDVADRWANIKERSGNFAGAFADRGRVLQQRGQAMQDQRGGLANLLMQAMLQGNQGQVEKLTDQIAELDVSIAENTQAIAANTVAARQAAIDNITRRGGFLGGIFSGLQGLVTAMGHITGVIDTPALQGLMQQGIGVLQQTGSGLAGQLLQGYGIDLRGLGGMDLVKALKNLNFDQIETSFTPEQRDQFESLISAIIDNATAVATNTDQLNQLNGGIAQSFSSTAWQLFREAIFTGSGGLLPSYSIPSMVTSSTAPSMMMMPGSSSIPTAPVAASVYASGDAGGNNTLGNGAPAGGREGDTNLYVTSPTEVLDPGYVAEVLAFKRGSARASS